MKFAPGQEFTDAMTASLRKLGYTVHVLDDLSRMADDPDNIDYEEVTYSADALLHLYFSQVGLYSPPWTIDYLPRVNATAIMFVKGLPDALYYETLYYGADAREGKKWAIVSDEAFTYSDFEVVLKNLDSVRAGFSAGVTEIATRMSEQIHGAIK